MKKKYFKWIALGFLLSLVCPSIALGAYYIKSSDLGENTQIVDPNNKNTLNKVIFEYNGKKETKYFPRGYSLTKKDLPDVLPNTQNSYFKWALKGNESQFIDSTKPYSASNTPASIKINGDSTILGQVITPSAQQTDVRNTIKAGSETVAGSIVYEKNWLNKDLNEVNINDNSAAGTKKPNIVEASGVVSGLIHSNFLNEDGKQTIDQNLGKNEFQANNDFTIGLEDEASEQSDFKPCGGIVGTNRCVSRLRLNGDLILSGSGCALEIGAKVGFFGNTDTWSQRNYQGFIHGSYSELDLNGFNVYVTNGAVLNAVGTVTNSHPELGGKIIVNSGGVLKATYVTEELNMERYVPVQYSRGGHLFSMYRMPYLNCNIQINSGGKFFGHLKFDTAGGGSDCVVKEFYIIGDVPIKVERKDVKPFISASGPQGYILRTVTYDKNIRNLKNLEGENPGSGIFKNFIERNMMHQKIRYDFYNFKGNNALNTNQIVFDYDFKHLVSFDVDFYKNNIAIPHYFSFYLHNCDLNLHYNVTYFPGAYLYVDSQSIIKLSALGIYNDNVPKKIAGIASTGVQQNYYQNVGGLNFALERGDYHEATFNGASNAADMKKLGWFEETHDGTPNQGRNGSTTLIHRYSYNLVSYLNKNQPACCDLEGKIEFVNIPEFTNTEYEQKHQIGGRINIKNVDEFAQTVANRNDVLCYASGAHIGPSTAYTAPLIDHGTQVADFLNSPIISYGNVLTDVDLNSQNYGKIRSDWKTVNHKFNFDNGLIETPTGKYGFITATKDASGTYKFNYDLSHMQKSYYGVDTNSFKNGVDSFYGKYFKVKNENNGRIGFEVSHTDGGQSNLTYYYIYYRGTFLPSPSATTVSVKKLRGCLSFLRKDLDANEATAFIRSVVYQDPTSTTFYNHKAWRNVRWQTTKY